VRVLEGYSKKDDISRIIKTHLSIFNDLFSAMIKIDHIFATTQTKMAIEPILKEHADIFKGFRLELRDLNYYRIIENCRGVENKTVFESMQGLTDAMYHKCKTLVDNVGVFVSNASREAILENYDALKRHRILDSLPEEFLKFKGGSKTVEIPYGKEHLQIDVPLTSEVLLPPEAEPIKNFEDGLKQSLENPIGTEKIEELIKKDENVAIIIDDYTRKTPTEKILPHLIKRIEKATKNIVIVMAIGLHKEPTGEQIKAKVGEYAGKYPVVIHDAKAEDLVNIRDMLTGTELKVNKAIAEADFVLSVGTIHPHPYAGFSGGAKNILPGVAGRDAIVSSHLLNIFPDCIVGKLRGNPMATEIRAAGMSANVGFIVNTILNNNGDVIDIVCGDLVKAFEAGVKVCEKIYSSKYSEKADIVVITPGGYPRDSTLYLSLRILKTAELVLKEKGVIILAARCEGEDIERIKKSLEYTLDDFLSRDPRDLISLNILNKYRVILVSSIEEEVLKELGVKGFDNFPDVPGDSNIQTQTVPSIVDGFDNFHDALREGMKEAGVDSKVMVIPNAYIIPMR
jgi:nickel-dependent lactate racemase